MTKDFSATHRERHRYLFLSQWYEAFNLSIIHAVIFSQILHKTIISLVDDAKSIY